MEQAHQPRPTDLVTWIARHPATSLFLFAVLSLFFVKPESGISSHGYVVILFGAGVYPFVAVLRTFASVFRAGFIALSFREQLRVTAMSISLLLVGSGTVFFFLVFLGEYYGQLTCRGGDCAQGGLGVFVFIPIAWLSYGATRLLCRVSTQHNWWPSTFKPKFP
jgi:hypothetical protein